MTRDSAPEPKTFFWSPSEFFPLNRVYLTTSEGFGERSYVENYSIIMLSIL